MVRLAQARAQQLQAQGDGIQRILDLMRDASGKPANRRQARGDVQLRGHALEQQIHIVALQSGIFTRAPILLAQQI